ncbi:MAG: tetratricopeptide repeat protein [Desulfobacteraceae bacterium]|nr:tetratricopeptide repeat protein [Desulfobacteraceae bacterium]
MFQEADLIKPQTLWVSVAVALVVGFLIGVGYSSLRMPAPPAGQMRAAPGNGQMSGPAPIPPQSLEAIAVLEKQVAANPKALDAWVQLGNLYFDSNQYQKAISAYNQYLELNPKNPNVLTDLGVMYRSAGQFKEAIAAFDRAIAVDPEQVQAQFNKGIVLFNDLHDPQGAIKVWQQLEDAHPGVAAANGLPVSKAIEEAKRQLAGEKK